MPTLSTSSAKAAAAAGRATKGNATGSPIPGAGSFRASARWPDAQALLTELKLEAYIPQFVEEEMTSISLLEEIVGRAEGERELMEALKTLEIRVGASLSSMSLSEILTKLVELSVDLPADGALWEREFARLAKKFKASDKMVWFVKINVYSRRQQWGMLAQLANSAKSPVGYKPFAVAAIKHRQPPSEVEKLHAKIAQMTLSDGAGQDFAARFFARTQSFSFDKQGRVGVSAELLSFAGIGKDAVLVGSLTKFNLYAPARWEKVEARTSDASFGDVMRRIGI
jgi:DNA-binding transcriptional regulator/RsmH inhibitor MraZ